MLTLGGRNVFCVYTRASLDAYCEVPVENLCNHVYSTLRSRDRVSLCEDIGYDEFIAQLPHFSTERIENTERSEEHTSELQSRETISYAVFCLKKKI